MCIRDRCRFFNVPRLLWQGPTVYFGHIYCRVFGSGAVTTCRGSYVRTWPCKSYNKNALFLFKLSSRFPDMVQTILFVWRVSIYSKMIAFVLRGYDTAFLSHCSFNYTMMGLLICKYEPFWQEVSVESLILRWPLRPVSLLFLISSYKSTLRYVDLPEN